MIINTIKTNCPYFTGTVKRIGKKQDKMQSSNQSGSQSDGTYNANALSADRDCSEINIPGFARKYISSKEAPGGKNMDRDNFFKSDNDECPIQDYVKLLGKRAKTLPVGLNALCAVTGRYLNGIINADDYVQSFTNISAPCYQRLELGIKNNEYRQAYEPEIKMILHISNICYKYRSDECDKSFFDNEITQAVKEYAESEIKRKQNFIV